jgi:hopene-associated glycosyltransferase HpnB
MLNDAVGALALAIWAYLLAARGLFWLGTERDAGTPPMPAAWPPVAVVIPARDEAETIARVVGSLLRQDYPGALSVTLVDDNSTDGTAEVARRAAAAITGTKATLNIVSGQPLPAGWTGKLWAVKQGIDAAENAPTRPEYLLLTDADIEHAPDSVRWLVTQAQRSGSVLTSFMAKLRCESLVERIHVPAFIFFFQMLYPFAWVNRPQSATAAAAGGCMLVRADALRQAGGIGIIRDALIDDCALAAKLKAHGPIWLGLTERVQSIRPYDGWEEARRMISRSAYAQLQYSPLLLAGTVLGMVLTYLAPPFLALFGSGLAQIFGAGAWALMAIAFQPTLRFYRLSPLWGVALPAIAFLYLLYTLDSAYQYMAGRGGAWKGRAQANVSQR